MTYTATTFRLGRSTVVTLPKGLGIDSGTLITFTPTKNKTVNLKPKKTKVKSDAEVEKLVRSLAGGFKGGKHYTPEEMSKLYDKDVYKI